MPNLICFQTGSSTYLGERRWQAPRRWPRGRPSDRALAGGRRAAGRGERRAGHRRGQRDGDVCESRCRRWEAGSRRRTGWGRSGREADPAARWRLFGSALPAREGTPAGLDGPGLAPGDLPASSSPAQRAPPAGVGRGPHGAWSAPPGVTVTRRRLAPPAAPARGSRVCPGRGVQPEARCGPARPQPGDSVLSSLQFSQQITFRFLKVNIFHEPRKRQLGQSPPAACCPARHFLRVSIYGVYRCTSALSHALFDLLTLKKNGIFFLLM